MTNFKVGDEVRLLEANCGSDIGDTVVLQRNNVCFINSYDRHKFAAQFRNGFDCVELDNVELFSPKKKVVKKRCTCTIVGRWPLYYEDYSSCPLHTPKKPVGRPRKRINVNKLVRLASSINNDGLPQKIDIESSSVAIASKVNELITYLERINSEKH